MFLISLMHHHPPIFSPSSRCDPGWVVDSFHGLFYFFYSNLSSLALLISHISLAHAHLLEFHSLTLQKSVFVYYKVGYVAIFDMIKRRLANFKT